MTFPGASQGGGRPPLDGAANAAISAARGRIGPQRPAFPAPPPQHLTDEQRAEAVDVIGKGGGCPCCGGIHTQEDYGCPRLSWFRRDADGMLVEGTYFPDGQWDAERVIFADPKGETGDGPHPG